jgi:HD-GYP domain-containing protein (c-di-GMP phosphodiesterase class II)
LSGSNFRNFRSFLQVQARAARKDGGMLLEGLLEEAFSDLIKAAGDYTAHHSRSVVALTAGVAEELGLDRLARHEIEVAALLHDVGKIAIPSQILNKPATLTDEEFELMKTHTIEGQALLDGLGGRFTRVGGIVRSCHERWNGTGYPDGLAGEEIQVAARIVFCCDAYSAMTTDRPYRRAMSADTALDELRRNSGTQFEPRVVEALHRLLTRQSRIAEPRSYAGSAGAVLVNPLPHSAY